MWHRKLGKGTCVHYYSQLVAVLLQRARVAWWTSACLPACLRACLPACLPARSAPASLPSSDSAPARLAHPARPPYSPAGQSALSWGRGCHPIESQEHGGYPQLELHNQCSHRGRQKEGSASMPNQSVTRSAWIRHVLLLLVGAAPACLCCGCGEPEPESSQLSKPGATKTTEQQIERAIRSHVRSMDAVGPSAAARYLLFLQV